MQLSGPGLSMTSYLPSLAKPKFDFYQFRRTYLTLHVLVPAFLIGAFAVFIFLELILPEIDARTAFWGAPKYIVQKDPTNTRTNAKAFSFKGRYGLYTQKRTYILEPIADYNIEARVLHKRRYWSDDNSADLVPFDMGLGWKNMSDLKILEKYFLFYHINLGGRCLLIDWKTNAEETPLSIIEEMRSGVSSSNNHLIPADEKTFKVLAKMKAGDIVRLKGYLVDIKDPNRPWWKWITTKYDRSNPSKYSKWGDGETYDGYVSCDTMFVKEAEILKAK